jgi:hypothetical protein
MNVTLSIEDETLRRARKQAEAMGKSVNQLIREYLQQLSGAVDNDRIADEFIALSKRSNGRSKGWRFDRDELHER